MPTSIQKASVFVPDFESPILTSYTSVSGAAINLRDESATAKVLVRSDLPQFGIGFGSSIESGDALIAGTRPDEWLILGSEAAVAAAAASVDEGGFTSVIPYTHGRALFRVSGDPAASMLEKICGIDWSDAMTPDGAVVSASVALTTCDIVRNDQSGTRSYLLQCDRSFGQYLFDALVDAATEFGVSVES